VFDWLSGTIVEFVARYGWAALFVFVVLETAWIMHFAPSEVVIPVAALYFVTGPTTFVAFVVVLTAASVLGSLLCYWLFGVNGDRVLSRYEHRLPTRELDRGRAWFDRHGEALVLWGRLVPVVRTPLSVPAGVTGMDRRRFVAYSAVGWLVYWVPLSLLGYSGETGTAPIEVAWGAAAGFARSNPATAAVVGVAVAAATGLVAVRWDRRPATPRRE
jgi:membrane protein DedA with SNARE-associated domain